MRVSPTPDVVTRVFMNFMLFHDVAAADVEPWESARALERVSYTQESPQRKRKKLRGRWEMGAATEARTTRES